MQGPFLFKTILKGRFIVACCLACSWGIKNMLRKEVKSV